MKKEEQKLFLSYSQDEIKIIHKFIYNDRKYCVYYLERGQEGYRVVEENYIIPEEKTEAYSRKQELEKLKKEHDKEVKKIQDDALKTLKSRVQLNVAFGNYSQTEMLVSTQIMSTLEKIIKKESLII